MPSSPRCPTCGGSFYPDPDDQLAVVCLLCARSFKLADLRKPSAIPTATISVLPSRERQEDAA
jgi:hypothetical protein